MKKRAFVKHTKQGRLIPGSLIVTTNGGYPIDGLYTEVPTNICCDTDVPGTITSSPKGWVRYTKKGAIVPGSLVVGKSYPKDGVWKEVYVDMCCATTGSNRFISDVFSPPTNGFFNILNLCTEETLLDPNQAGVINPGATCVEIENYNQLYISLNDSNGVYSNELASMEGNSGTLTFTQGSNSVTYSFTADSFIIVNTFNVIVFDTTLGSVPGSLVVTSPATGSFNTVDPITIIVG